VEIYGPEGTIRDYIHVHDVATGILAVLQQGKEGNIYNVGTGIGSSNLDLLRLLQGLAEADGFSVRVSHLPERRFDVAANVLDSRKLFAATGWAPRISLAEGLEAMWRHGLQRKFERGSRP
jgi:UDP-glucose 4-epimerase